MSRQLDQEQELRDARKRDELYEALEYKLVGALEHQGILLVGIAIKYDTFNCLMTLKAYRGDNRCVAFVGSDSIMNCFLRAASDAARCSLKWRKDKYYDSDG